MKQPKFSIGDQVYFTSLDAYSNNRHIVCSGNILSVEPAWDDAFSYMVKHGDEPTFFMENSLFVYNPEELVHHANHKKYNETLLEIEQAELYKRKTQSRIDNAKHLLSSDLYKNYLFRFYHEEMIIGDNTYDSYFYTLHIVGNKHPNRTKNNKEMLENYIKQQEELLLYLQTDLELFTEKKADLEDVLSEFSNDLKMNM